MIRFESGAFLVYEKLGEEDSIFFKIFYFLGGNIHGVVPNWICEEHHL